MSAASDGVLREALEKLITGQSLDGPTMEAAVGAIMDGVAEPAEIAALLTALRMKGETIVEIAGAARAMRSRASSIPTTRTGLLDTCGTGGDGLRTFNISTATAIVAAAAGVPVAKHGNRSVSSSSGSADVLQTLGVNLELTPEQVGRCLDEVGIAFCFAPVVHGAMKHAAPVRRTLGFRTLFNLLGPLTNPAGAEFQLLGVGDVATAEKLAGALQQLDTTRALVVTGAGGLDEVSLWGKTEAFLIEDADIRQLSWTPDDFGLAPCTPEELVVATPAASASVITGVLAGEQTAAARIVAANTAVALMAAGVATTPREGVDIAQRVLQDGSAGDVLERLTGWQPADS